MNPNKISTTSMIIGGGAAWLAYNAFARKAKDDQVARMKGEREVSLLGAAAGYTLAAGAVYKAAHTPFAEYIEKSKILSEKNLQSHDAKGFLNKFKTPNMFLAGSAALAAYGTFGTTVNLASGENHFRAPLLSTTLGVAGVMAYSQYAKNDFDIDRAVKGTYDSVEGFFRANGSTKIQGIKDFAKSTVDKIEKGTLIPDNVPGARYLNGAIKHTPKSHVAKLALFGGGLIATGQMTGIFDRSSDVMLPESRGGQGRYLGPNTSNARYASGNGNEKRYTQASRNSTNQQSRPTGAYLV